MRVATARRRRERLVIEYERGIRGGSAANEQTNRRVVAQCRCIGPGIREGQRRDEELVLGADPESRAARDEHLHRWRGGDQLCDRRCRTHDLLEVVEHEERTATRVRRRDGVDQVPSILGLNAGRRRDGRRDPRRIVERSEVDERDAIHVRLELAGDVNREPRLPRASGTGERQEPNVCSIEQRHDRAELRLAANHLAVDVRQG
jgi:hypothetical protein